MNIERDTGSVEKGMDARCWRTIGVWGSIRPKCPELEKLFHCNNCEVFKSAAHTSFNRISPPGYLDEQSRRYGENIVVRDILSIPAVIFRLANEWYAIATSTAGEIIPPKPTRQIPHINSSIVLGLVNVRSRLCISISLHQLLGINICEVEDRSARRISDRRMLVLKASEESTYIFTVDQIAAVERLTKLDAELDRVEVESDLIKFKVHWKNKIVWLLDSEKLFEGIAKAIKA